MLAEHEFPNCFGNRHLPFRPTRIPKRARTLCDGGHSGRFRIFVIRFDSAPSGGNINRCSDREFAFSRLGAA
jgi:hypothetical protein